MSEVLSASLYERCFAFACSVHEGQTRKGKTIPYIEHPKAVVLLLATVTKDPETLSSGILHDTVEDCDPYGWVTLQTLRELATDRVARMVGDVTEKDKTLPWEVRKQEVLERIAVIEQDSQLLKTGDSVANLKELNIDLLSLPADEVFSRFRVGRKRSIEQHERVYDALAARWSANPLLSDFELQLNNLLLF